MERLAVSRRALLEGPVNEIVIFSAAIGQRVPSTGFGFDIAATAPDALACPCYAAGYWMRNFPVMRQE